MKKIIYILPFLITLFLTSCEVEGNDSPNPRTLEAKVSYDAVESSLSESISLLDLMTKISYYAQAADDKKAGIKDFFLPNYSITNVDDTWILKDSYQEIAFTNNNKYLNDESAVWSAKITLKQWEGTTQTSVDNKNYNVQRLGNNEWKITTVNFLYNYYQGGNQTNAELYVKGSKAYEQSTSLYIFSIERGSGVIDAYSTKLPYKIVQPLIFSTDKYSSRLNLTDGEVNINADKENEIKAAIASSKVTITYKGITETY